MKEDAFRKVQSEYRGLGIRLHVRFLNRSYMAPKETKLKEGDTVFVEGETIQRGESDTRDGIDECMVFGMGGFRDNDGEKWMVG